MGNKDQEKGMNERGDIVPQGPAQEEVEEVNKQSLRSADLKPRPLRRPGFLGKIVNAGLALSMFGSMAALKAKAEENTVSQTTPQVEPSNNQEVQNTPPSAPGVKVEFPTADAPATEFKPTKRIFIPMVAKNFKEPETPLYLREFGAPERGVVMKNRVEQGGGNPAWVQLGDQELWDNLLYLRETYGRPDLKLEITYYSSLELYSRDPNRPNYNPENNFVLYWDVWAGNPGIYKNGVRIFSYREADKTLEFRIVLPETLPGKVPTEDSVNRMHRDFTHLMLETFLSKEDGKRPAAFQHYASGEEPEYSDFRAHPVVVTNPEPRPSFFSVSRSALWVKLE